ncbi:hypothetical protein F4805DRAFT_434687 [Annulohypoxylon moriforme]|nr:hypothetical protein F4805DRAFT_434687 [Annulohypoxylon moriforme]
MSISISRRPQVFRAPSWSWASVDTLDNSECYFWQFGEHAAYNPIPFDGSKSRIVCTMYDAYCQPKTNDMFGEVIGGFVKLRAFSIAARISTELQENGAWTLSCVEDGTDVYIACLIASWKTTV